ncbi:MAG: adenosylmethionine--8-amino-7-oxononanoate transaminase [Kiritimatiellia bacterium]|nr:adenosylmethionine--8-amino-7-oxononanoate transaminase [Lentisphaerota bacterium]
MSIGPPPHGLSSDWRAKDRRAVWHPYSRFSEIEQQDFPIIVRGRGSYLYDAEGCRYLDAISSWWACNLGHGRREITRAITSQAALLQHSILGNMSHPPAIELALDLTELFPGPRRVVFAGDGACSVEAALRIAVQYWHNRDRPGKRLLASLEQAYHGDTVGAMSVGYQPLFHAPFRHMLFKTLQAPSPCCAACTWDRQSDTCQRECFRPMRELITRHADELAAVIVEPMCQGAAGMRIYHADYLRQLADLCRECEVLLIVDEIAMGMGRTGRMFAHQHAGIDPDIVCLGKGLSAGYLPISAAIVREDIQQTFTDGPRDNTFYHGHTFAGNPLACAAALATLKFYREHRVLDTVSSNTQILAEAWSSLADCRGVKSPRTLGMVAACEIDGPPATTLRQAREIRQRMLKYGILIRPLGNTIYLMPPLLTAPGVLRNAVRSLKRAIRATTA